MAVHELVGKGKQKRAEEPDAAQPVRRSTTQLVVGGAGDWAERAADQAGHAALRRLNANANPTASTETGTAGEPGIASPTNAPLPTMSAAPGAIGADGGALSDQLANRVTAARPSGQSLPGPLRRRMEGAFGSSLGHVRIHTGGESNQLNRAMSARAFTTGNDIFFGAGQFQPESAAGQQVLAHEIAHTTQDSGVRRQVIHRWNLNSGPIDWSKTQTVGTVDSGQAVWFFADNTGDKIAVKKEDKPIGLSELAAGMHEAISNVKSVKHRKLTGADAVAVGSFVTDPAGRKFDRPQWTALGTAQRKDPEFSEQLRDALGDRMDAMNDFELGQFIQASKFDPRHQLVAMSFAAGDTAKKAAGTREIVGHNRQGAVETTKLRRLMIDRRHMQALGKLTAVDLFLGNMDRVMEGNLGNWIYDPESAAMTAIDHVDDGVKGWLRSDQQTESDMRELLKPLALANLGGTAAHAVRGITRGAKTMGGDAGFGAWLDGDGGNRRTFAEEALEDGLKEGRKLLVKTFTATRFSGSRKARAVKKTIKKAAKTANKVDSDDDPGQGLNQLDYFQVLKARARYLAKH